MEIQLNGKHFYKKKSRVKLRTFILFNWVDFFFSVIDNFFQTIKATLFL